MVLCWLRYGMGLCGAALFYVRLSRLAGGLCAGAHPAFALFSLASACHRPFAAGEVLLAAGRGKKRGALPGAGASEGPWGLPLSRVAFQLEYQNLFSGQKGRESHSFP